MQFINYYYMIADNLPIDEILNLVIEKFQNYIDEENEKFIELTKSIAQIMNQRSN